VAGPDPLYSSIPSARLHAARGLSERARRKVATGIVGWPDHSPGSVNAWLLLVTTKSPSWKDPLLPWPEGPLTFGEPHPGFIYPDPIGFWVEVRRWSIELFHAFEPHWSTAEALSLTALVHIGDDPARLAAAQATCRPRMTVFLDEPAWQVADLDVATSPLAVPDPHRPGQVYEGWWGTTADGSVVGKAPQHPTMHRLYAASDLTNWLHKAPAPRP
jgi:hypothetical protein